MALECGSKVLVFVKKFYKTMYTISFATQMDGGGKVSFVSLISADGEHHQAVRKWSEQTVGDHAAPPWWIQALEGACWCSENDSWPQQAAQP